MNDRVGLSKEVVDSYNVTNQCSKSIYIREMSFLVLYDSVSDRITTY